MVVIPPIVSGTLDARPPFDFAKSLAFLHDFGPMRDDQRIEPHSLIKAVIANGQTIIFQVSASATNPNELDYTLFAEEPIRPETDAAARDRIAFFLSLNDDLAPLYEIGMQDEAFAPVIQQLYGYHQVKFLTPFESICWAILTQRTPMVRARQEKQALSQRYGSSIKLDEYVYNAFPTPGRLASDSNEAALSEVVGHPRKGSYLAAAAQAFALVDEEWMRTAPYDEVEAWLRSIHGIGAWSATFVLLRGLGRMDRLPDNEERLGHAVAHRYNGSEIVTHMFIRRVAAPYENYQGYWAHYLRVAG